MSFLMLKSPKKRDKIIIKDNGLNQGNGTAIHKDVCIDILNTYLNKVLVKE